jgi:hypothetical protein
MSPWSEIGRLLIILGVLLVAVGLLLNLFPKLPLGRLPGDIVWKRPGMTIYFPWVTCLVISIVLSIIVYLFKK